jgi:hypothetical protein
MATYETRTLSPGIAPAEIALINSTNNYSGNTKLGLMQYLGGSTYNGGVALTVTSSVSPTSSFYKFIPYQLADGSWRMRFNIGLVFSASQTSGSLTVTGVTFKSNGAIAYQSASVANSSAPAAVQGIYDNTANTIRFFSSAGANNWGISGDVELDSKPTWAY